MFSRTKSKAKPVALKPVPVRRPVHHHNGDADIGGLGQALWYKKWRIIVPALVAGALAFVVVNLMTPRYKSETRILLEPRENVFLRAEADKDKNALPIDPEAVASQIQLVMSRDLALNVIRSEKLGEKADFDPNIGGISPIKAIFDMLGFGRDTSAMSAQERVLETYYSRLNAFAVDKTRVIVVEFSAADPDVAARVANSIANNYLAMQQSAKQTQTREASGWLANEITSMRSKVAEAEAKVEEYRAKSNLYVGSNNSSLPNQQLTEINSQISAARAQKADLEARARRLRELLRSGRSIDSSDVANSESMRRLSDQRTALRSQLAEQSSTLLDQHPRIKELRAQIGELDAQIRVEGDRLARSLDNDAQVASSRLEMLTASLDQVKKIASQSNEQDVQLRALERESKAQRDLLESYLAKYREASARENINAAPADARIISPATPAILPASPKKLPIVVIVTLAVLVLQTVFVITGEMLSPTVLAYPETVPAAPPVREPNVDMSMRRRRKVTPKAVPVAAPVPAIRPKRPAAPRGGVVTIQTPEQAFDAIQSMGEQARHLAVMGTERNVGTTYASISLARALAQESTVVLVDLDFNSPNLSVISNDPNAPGIADLAHGAASFGDIITSDQFSTVHIVAAGSVGGDAAALLASPVLADMIEALAETYDYVIVDAGPVSEADVAYVASMCQAAVLVADNPSVATSVAGELRAAGFASVTAMSGGAQAAAA